MSSPHISNTMSIEDFKDKFGHYYSVDALSTMTGIRHYTNGCCIPTYKTRNDKVMNYYDSLIKEFSLLYNCLNQPIESIYDYTSNTNWYDNKREWYNALQPQHIAILNFIKNGDIDNLRKINNQGWKIGFHKASMLKVAIDNKQIESIDYLIKTKQINSGIEEHIITTTPEFYDVLISKYHIKLMNKIEKSNNISGDKQLYLYYSNLHWINPETTYLNLKYSYSGWYDLTKPLESSYINTKLLEHIIKKYNIDENHMLEIIKRPQNHHRYIAYCFRNNKIHDLKYFFENECLNKCWNSGKIYELVKTCIYYNCLELLSSLKIVNINKHEQHRDKNLIFHKKKIREIIKDDNDTYDLIKQIYETVFHKFDNICL